MSARLRVVVCGYVVRGPLGGLAWHHLQYVLGLHRMGHDVLFVEDSDDYESCYDPRTDAMGADPSYGLSFAADAFDRLGLGDRWGYYDQHTDRWSGPISSDAVARICSADVLLNVSAVNPPRAWWEDVPRRALIDTDPAFTQLRHLQNPFDGEQARAAHTNFFTFAENVGGIGEVPDDGLPWQPTRQPVVIDSWPVVAAERTAPWTTVMQWDSYKERRHAGVLYGMKSRSFEPYFNLPRRLPDERLTLAVGNPTAPRSRLEAIGWGVVDPITITRTPWTYREFVQASKGEFGVAKHGYVVSRSGWFSERTAGYLASGKPAVVQDTAFTEWLPTGEGLFAFTDLEEAVAGLAAVDADYERHCLAARDLAAAYFGHAQVLDDLLAAVAAG